MNIVLTPSNREKELLKILLEEKIKTFGDNEANLLRIEYERILRRL